MTPSEVIKKIRWELRLSQEALARELDCSQTAISAWEGGDRLPRYDWLVKIKSFAKMHKIKVDLL